MANDGSANVSVIDLATNTVSATVGVGTGPFGVAITPDQAPTASFTASAGAAGSATSFDASASSAPFGTITSYAWAFGDGSSATTTTATTTHTYLNPGTYTVTLTVTDSAGTSTTQVFTGQTVSRNGGPSATTSRSVMIAAPPTPPTPTTPSTAGSVLAATPDGGGYWIAHPDGGVFSYGDAVFHGSLVGTVTSTPRSPGWLRRPTAGATG